MSMIACPCHGLHGHHGHIAQAAARSIRAIATAHKPPGPIMRTEEEVRQRDGYTAALPYRKPESTRLHFPDHPGFHPNLTPEEIIRAGSFGGTYFRPIDSSVTGISYDRQWEELPTSWLEGLDISKYISSSEYDPKVNTYGRKVGAELEMWESKGWMVAEDPYGWFQWYCRFYLGRRMHDDERQIMRWKNFTGVKGRWRIRIIKELKANGAKWDDTTAFEGIRQILQHWGYRITAEDTEEQK